MCGNERGPWRADRRTGSRRGKGVTCARGDRLDACDVVASDRFLVPRDDLNARQMIEPIRQRRDIGRRRAIRNRKRPKDDERRPTSAPRPGGERLSRHVPGAWRCRPPGLWDLERHPRAIERRRRKAPGQEAETYRKSDDVESRVRLRRISGLVLHVEIAPRAAVNGNDGRGSLEAGRWCERDESSIPSVRIAQRGGRSRRDARSFSTIAKCGGMIRRIAHTSRVCAEESRAGIPAIARLCVVDASSGQGTRASRGGTLSTAGAGAIGSHDSESPSVGRSGAWHPAARASRTETPKAQPQSTANARIRSPQMCLVHDTRTHPRNAHRNRPERSRTRHVD